LVTFTQIHPIALPEFSLHMQTKLLRMISLLFYKLQNTFNKILATGWTVRESNSDGGEIFRTCPDRSCGHPAICTMGTVSFQGVKSGQGVTLTLTTFYCCGHERGEIYLFSPCGSYGLYRASVPVQGCALLFCSNKICIFLKEVKISDRRGQKIN